MKDKPDGNCPNCGKEIFRVYFGDKVDRWRCVKCGVFEQQDLDKYFFNKQSKNRW